MQRRLTSPRDTPKSCQSSQACLVNLPCISTEVQTGPAMVSPWRVIISGILVNTLNPKLTIFFFAFLPQFVAPDRDGAVLLMVWLSAIFMAVTLVVFSVYGVFAAAVRREVISRPRIVAWMRRSFAATYLILAGRLAAQTR